VRQRPAADCGRVLVDSVLVDSLDASSPSRNELRASACALRLTLADAVNDRSTRAWAWVWPAGVSCTTLGGGQGRGGSNPSTPPAGQRGGHT